MICRFVISIHFIAFFTFIASAQQKKGNVEPAKIAELNGKTAVANSLLVKLKKANLRENKALTNLQILAADGCVVIKSYKMIPSLYQVSIINEADAKAVKNNKQLSKKDKGTLLINSMKKMMASGNYEYVEPDWIININDRPTDTAFTDGSLWGLENTGQNGGVPGVDVNVVPAWETTRGSQDVVVAVIDTGIRYTHTDLINNMWVNEAELNGLAGVDDDGNGYIDDIHGCDPANNDGDPFDDNDHGTHCAGTIAATADDSGQIVGVAPNVKLMACKFLTSEGSGATSDAIDCIDYAVSMGADILSNSWGGGGFSSALFDAIQASNQAGTLFVAAAGNSSSNNDGFDNYPSNYEVENVVAVAAIDRSGNLASFSSYGRTTVDIAGPGVDVLSSVSANDNAYDVFSGTSMATPHVAGVAALLKSAYPNITVSEYKTRLYSSVRPLPALSGLTLTEGLVDASAALNISADGNLEVRLYPESAPINRNEDTVFFASVNDLDVILDATVTATLEDNSVITFLDNGIAPDITANDGIYSSIISVGAVDNISMDLVVNATGKNTFTNSYLFNVVSPPANDDIADAIVFTDFTGTHSESTVLATGEVGEPTHTSSSTTNSIWYAISPPVGAETTINTFGSNYDTTLTVYTISNGVYNLITGNDDSGSLQSQVTFTPIGGATYYIAVDGFSSSTGNAQLNYEVSGPDGTLEIDLHPAATPFQGDEFMVLYATVTDSSPILGATVSGELADSTTIQFRDNGIAPDITANDGTYSATVNINGQSEVAIDLFVTATDKIPFQDSYLFSVVAPVEGDFFSLAQELTGFNANDTGINTEATIEVGEDLHHGSNSTTTVNSLWWKYTPLYNGELTVNTFDSGYDTILASYTGNSVTSLNLEAFNDDASGLDSQIVFNVTAGTTYYLMVDGYSSSTGTNNINLNFIPNGYEDFIGGTYTGGDSLPNADPDGDSITNLVTYALGLTHGSHGIDSNGVDRRPKAVASETHGGIQFIMPTVAAHDINFEIAESTNLGAWEMIAQKSGNDTWNPETGINIVEEDMLNGSTKMTIYHSEGYEEQGNGFLTLRVFLNN